jgi:hypothetical protein
MPDNPQNSLGKAGAGLPKLQAIFLRHIGFPMLRRFLSWEGALSIFESEGHKVLKLVDGLSQEQMNTQVLVPKTMGIEDNSRYYSAAMVLWHLIYVGETISDGVVSLSRGETLDLTVKIENFKPFVDISPKIADEYQIFLNNYRPSIEKNVHDRRKANYHSHPWFGPLNPHGWLVLSAVHQQIHRRQLENIVKGLKA